MNTHIHAYIHTYIQCTYIHTMYLHTYNVHTYIQCTYIHTMYLHTYVHTHIHIDTACVLHVNVGLAQARPNKITAIFIFQASHDYGCRSHLQVQGSGSRGLEESRGCQRRESQKGQKSLSKLLPRNVIIVYSCACKSA